MKYKPTLIVLGLAVALSGSARAQSDADRATARSLFFLASEAMEKRDYAAAAELFGRSDAIVHAPTASLGFARAQVGLGRLVAAYETYNRILREGVPAGASAAFEKALQDARREATALEARLPTVVIVVTGHPEPSVKIDGAAVPKAALGVKRFVDPGAHEVQATAEGFLPAQIKFSVEEGRMARAELVLARDPKFPPIGSGTEPGAAAATAPSAAAAAAPAAARPASGEGSSSSRRTLGFVVAGVGVVGLGVGAVAGLSFLGKKSTAEEHCLAGAGNTRLCDAEGLDAVDAAGTLGTVSTIGWIGGAVALAGGVALVLTAPRGGARTSTAILPGVGRDGAALFVRRSFE